MIQPVRVRVQSSEFITSAGRDTMGRNLFICNIATADAIETLGHCQAGQGRAGDHACLPEASEIRGGCVQT